MHIVLNIALALSILAVVPSAAAFTPVILISGIAALIAVVAIWRGYLRRGLLTVYFAICAFIVSPMFFDFERVEWLLVALLLAGIIGGAGALWDYKRRILTME